MLNNLSDNIFHSNYLLLSNTYLGNKGYTIYKNELTLAQQKFLRNELTITPRTHGAPLTNNLHSYPVYRESDNKFYVPHYYGTKYFGTPKSIKITNGDNINLEFNGKLRDNQEIVVNTYLNYVKKETCSSGLLELPCAYGKTVLSLSIISQLNKKTFIIVHKEFLMNQWIERINQFLPKAKIGKIQGQVIDIEDKDIVIGMLQSLSMKEYPANLFDSFGLTIIDEVHHISSEVFSNSLFKLKTKYMLGLSATMNRKDGTTHVFKMFLGEVVYKGDREEQHPVIVRGIEYIVDDDEFNEVKLDYRGNPAYSSMISKLCEYNHRSEFIIKVIKDLLIENQNKQIMILAHNKNLLKYLYNAIEHRNLATVGYYLGGMKESALKETESKQIVIATYAMAAEALDIKTLSILIMATPKTDIEQSVGRILRSKHSNPIVVDIIDKHDIFKNQWRKRKTFYKRENYKITYMNSIQYNSDSSNWETIYLPRPKLEKKPHIIVKSKKTKTEKSNGSSDKSIAQDSDSDEETSDIPKDKFLCGKCMLPF